MRFWEFSWTSRDEFKNLFDIAAGLGGEEQLGTMLQEADFLFNALQAVLHPEPLYQVPFVEKDDAAFAGLLDLVGDLFFLGSHALLRVQH